MWWDKHYTHVKKCFKGQLWSQRVAWSKLNPDINYLDSFDRPGLSRSQGVIHQGANSGYQAINLAYLLGAKLILLLGYDSQGIGDHWFGKHPIGLSQATNYSNLIQHFRSIKPADYGIEIINCSRSTALTFPRMPIDEALRNIRYRAKPRKAGTTLDDVVAAE